MSSVMPAPSRTTRQDGISVRRHFTKPGVDPLSEVTWERRRAEIKGGDGKIISAMDDVEVPVGWSQSALDIAVDKYFRKAGVPGRGHEHSVRHLVTRVAKAVRLSGEVQGYFASAQDADTFEAEMTFMLVNQYGAFNSPVWFNTGLYESYGIKGDPSGLCAWDRETGKVFETDGCYVRPQVSACFIQSIEDDLMDIADFVKREMRLFKFGSGSGANFSKLRGFNEPLSGGGTSSGMMSFLRVFDVSAGSIKSGGVCLAPTQRVYTERGPIAVKELADKGEDFVVLSYDPPAQRYKAKAARAWAAGHKKVMRITTDKGEFDLTHDHPVKLSSEETVRVENLKPGMSMFACTVDFDSGTGKYLRVGLKDGQKGRMRFNRLIAQDIMGLEIEGYSIHHEDEDTFNNHPSNLVKKLQADHARDHNLEYVASGEHVFQNESFPHDGESNGMHSSSDFWKDDGKVGAYKAKQGEILKNSGRAAVMQHDAATQKMLNLGYKLINAGHDISTFDAYWQARGSVVGRIGNSKEDLLAKFVERFGSYDGFVKELLGNNHRIVSIREIGEMDVYDVEVDCPTPDDKSPQSGHNFVVWPSAEFTGSGVVVFNTRRAAKMVCVNVDHPDIMQFIEWKAKEEDKALALIKAGYSSDFNGEAYQTISGQNANNSVRVTDEFMQAVVAGKPWDTKWRKSGQIAHTLDARKLFRRMAECAWRCADPGIQFDTTINRWHTTPVSGRINAANPCCVTGNTLVDTSDGKVEIQKLAAMSAAKRHLPKAFAFDLEERLPVLRQIKRVWVSGEVSFLLEINTPGRVAVRCTPEHRFLTERGWIEAQHLAVGDALFTTTRDGRDIVMSIRSIELERPVQVFDMEVDGVHNFGVSSPTANGHSVVIHNSEYMSLDDSACNLASLNLMKFLKRRVGVSAAYDFDTAAYIHAASTFTLAQEILVDYAAYPTAKIAQNTHDFRQLGLGYANLGAMLMVQGIPYDNDLGRAVGGALTAILTGTGYRTSAEIAGAKGPFPGFAHNRVAMLEVMRMHESAIDKIDPSCPSSLVSAARTVWREAVDLGERNGYRNAQATVIAPTGTIGFMMDCDTTGVEPDFALVKHKKLAGGGVMEIANRSVGAALEVMGYTPIQVDEIVAYLKSSGMIEGAPHLKNEHLPAFDCANRCGKVQVIDGQKRLVVGRRFIEPMGHVKMLEAVQPFVSGSISKTVNCPKETTVEEIEQIHMEAWKRGLKCVAIYRDDSKHAQVLSSGDGVKSDKADKADVASVVQKAVAATPSVSLQRVSVDADIDADADDAPVTLERPDHDDDNERSGLAPPRTQRRRLPKKRDNGETWELKVGGQKVYLRSSEYADGSVGEVFVDMHKDGATLRSLMNCFSIAISLGLQHGVPLQEFVTAFTFQKFEPAGAVDHPHIKRAMSVVDAIFRVLACEYMGKDAFEQYAQQQPTPEELEDMRARKAIKLMLAQARSKKTPVKLVSTPVNNGNGSSNGNGHKTASFRRSSLSDSQACSRCGGLTQRSGTCHTCISCGQTSGCS